MNSVRKILHKMAKESNGKMRIVPVPEDQRLTNDSLERLEREINAQIETNNVVRSTSYINASKRF